MVSYGRKRVLGLIEWARLGNPRQANRPTHLPTPARRSAPQTQTHCSELRPHVDPGVVVEGDRDRILEDVEISDVPP